MEFKSSSSNSTHSLLSPAERAGSDISRRPTKRRRIESDSDTSSPPRSKSTKSGGGGTTGGGVESVEVLDEEITRAKRSLAILEARKRLRSLDEERVGLLRTLEALEGDFYGSGVGVGVSKEGMGTYDGGERVPPGACAPKPSAIIKSNHNGEETKQASALSCNRCWQLGFECLRTKRPEEGCDSCVDRGRICVLRRVGGSKKKKGTKSEGN